MEVDILITGGVYDDKIEKVLNKLLDIHFKVKSDVYLNLFLTHIIKYQEKNKIDDNLTNTFCCWIIQATKEWESSTQPVAPDIFAFAIHLASYISEEETRFVKLNALNVYERLLAIKKDIHSAPPTIKLGFITLISAFLKHKSGLQWIMATDYWTSIIAITLKAHTIYITSAGCKFIANLLEKTFDLNKTYCRNIIKSILTPLDNILDQPNINTIHLELFPILRLITDVLSLLLQRTTSKELLEFFINGFELSTKLKNFLLFSETEEFEYEIRNLMFLMDFVDYFKLFSGSEKISYTLLDSAKKEKSQETFRELIRKGYTKSVLRICYNGFIFWKSIKNKMPKIFHQDQQIQIENQFMMMQILAPALASTLWIGQYNIEKLINLDTLRDDFVNKILRIGCERTVPTIYIWRNYLLDNPNTFKISTTSLLYILKSKQFYTREGGVMTFQAFMYCFKDIIDHLKACPANIQLRPQKIKFLEALLEALKVFIEEFDITWKDSIESVSAMTFAVQLLHFTIWTPQVVIKGLRLLNSTIDKYLASSMALLIDTSHDASVSSLGTLLNSKCHDSCWEIRDSALEVLCTMAYNANSKFPFFKKNILDADLPHLIVNMAIKDPEPFVRASALRCLQEMVQIEQFWDNLAKIKDIHERFFNIVSRETEGIVRKEATTLIYKIYDNMNYHESLFSNLYDVMTHSTIADLHWEVKVNALSFWKSVINNHLHHQGMIDGIFPTVTFSKERRKIINLDDVEVKKRLNKVLNQLSENGCLAVLIAASQDDCDIDVSRSAIAIVSEFVSLLKRYEINEENCDLFSSPINTIDSPEEFHDDSSATLSVDLDNSLPFSDSNSLLFEISSDSWRLVVTEHSSVINSTDSNFNSPSSFSSFEPNQGLIRSVRAADVTDDILDEILNSTDINVLTSLNKPGDNSLNDTKILLKKMVVPPREFISFAYKNLESNLSEKSSGLDDFESLLDDILKEYD